MALTEDLCGNGSRTRSAVPGSRPAQNDKVLLDKRKDLFHDLTSTSILDPQLKSSLLEKNFKCFSMFLSNHRIYSAFLFVAFINIIFAFHVAVEEGFQRRLLLVLLQTGLGTASIFWFLLTRLAVFRRWKTALTSSIVLWVGFVASDLLTTYHISDNNYRIALSFVVSIVFILISFCSLSMLPLYVCLPLSTVYVMLREVLTYLGAQQSDDFWLQILIRAVLYLLVEILGASLHVWVQVVTRNTYANAGQSLMAIRDSEADLKRKNKIVRFVMPDVVAQKVIESSIRDSNAGGDQVFRPYMVYRTDNVSILFADMVGFTDLSSGTEASVLVSLLNDLFGRFDLAAASNDCEKISTLGDCYYCVSGCPKTNPYHAFSCVEMGLDMLDEIVEFRKMSRTNVDMRIGIHSGSVLSGVLGNRRRRFDVWSNDVTLANKMESGGVPGRVHISAQTHALAQEKYDFEDGHGGSRNGALASMTTYLVVGRKKGQTGFKPWVDEQAPTLSSATESWNSGSSKPFCGATQNSLSAMGSHLLASDRKSASPMMESTISAVMGTCSGQSNGVSNSGVCLELSYQSRVHSSGSTLELPNPHPTAISLAKSEGQQIAASVDKTGDLQLQKETAERKLNQLFSDTFLPETTQSSPDHQLVEFIQQNPNYFLLTPMSVASLFFRKPLLEQAYRAFCCSRPMSRDPPSPPWSHDLLKHVHMLQLVTFMLAFSFVPAFLFRPVCYKVLVVSAVLVLPALHLLLPERLWPWGWTNLRRWCSPGSIGALVCTWGQSWHFQQMAYLLLATSPLLLVWFSVGFCGCTRLTISMGNLDFFLLMHTLALTHLCCHPQIWYVLRSSVALLSTTAFVALTWINPTSMCLRNSLLSGPLVLGVKQNLAILVYCLLLLLLVVYISRHYEFLMRMQFFMHSEAIHNKKISRIEQDVLNEIKRDLFPKYIQDDLLQGKYCKNHALVGVLFASVMNFRELYEETYQGGVEYLRFLHELVADFDKLLEDNPYVEKIKTTNGATIMAASGLNPNAPSSDPLVHLSSLMEFAISMGRVLDAFSKDVLVNFHLKMRLGFFAGPITAGIVGYTKPQFDIWGDTVNMASRMESTGVEGRVQMPESCLRYLESRFEFEQRCVLQIKGKGPIMTCLLKGRRTAS